jgi:hypothetical protein
MGLKGPQEKETETVNPRMFIGNPHQSISIPEPLQRSQKYFSHPEILC